MMSQVMLFLPPLLEGAWWTIALSFTAAFGAVAVGRAGLRLQDVEIVAPVPSCAHLYRDHPRHAASPAAFLSLLRLAGDRHRDAGLPRRRARPEPQFRRLILPSSSAPCIQSVDQGQRQAARSLGMSGLLVFYLVVMPQALRNIFPALGNYALVLVKNSLARRGHQRARADARGRAAGERHLQGARGLYARRRPVSSHLLRAFAQLYRRGAAAGHSRQPAGTPRLGRSRQKASDRARCRRQRGWASAAACGYHQTR